LALFTHLNHHQKLALCVHSSGIHTSIPEVVNNTYFGVHSLSGQYPHSSPHPPYDDELLLLLLEDELLLEPDEEDEEEDEEEAEEELDEEDEEEELDDEDEDDDDDELLLDEEEELPETSAPDDEPEGADDDDEEDELLDPTQHIATSSARSAYASNGNTGFHSSPVVLRHPSKGPTHSPISSSSFGFPSSSQSVQPYRYSPGVQGSSHLGVISPETSSQQPVRFTDMFSPRYYGHS
jgi:hypothetical protein